jgi:hypothetical protein
MPKIHLDRLKKRYGYKGEPYEELIQRILQNNEEMVARRIGEISQSQWWNAAAKISTKGKAFIVPSLEDVLPKRSVFTLKAAQNGKLISDTLRDRLTGELRETLAEFTPKTKEQAYIVRRGPTAGRINPKLVRELQEKIHSTFEAYTKKDPRFGVPSNVKNIAVTELRSSVSIVKREFTKVLLQKNPGLELKKTWIHNASLSKVPRKGHLQLNGKTIPYKELFTIPVYKSIKGKVVRTGSVTGDSPHAPGLPADQVIGCNCDIVYTARFKK